MIKQLAKDNEQKIIEWRRHLHANPELGEHEVETTKFIVEKLTAMGVDVQTFDDITGCIGTIKGESEGKTIMLRADIDALPIQEEAGKPYASKNAGVMHACGHDGHTAMLLGAAEILVSQKANLKGTVKLIFQMGEELGRRSELYVQRGALNGVDAIFGMHLWSLLDVGKANFEVGERMACSDRFTIKITGKASHGSAPHEGIDAILTSAAVVQALQSITSRNMHPQQSLVVTVGMMNGGTKSNIIADYVELVGTVRTFNKEFRKTMPERIEKVVKGVCDAYGCEAECIYYFGPSPLINENEELVTIAQDVAKNIIGDKCLVPFTKMMGAEDFSVFLEEIDGVYGFVGARNKDKGIDCVHHHPAFDLDEDVLHQGSAIYAQFAVDYLNK